MKHLKEEAARTCRCRICTYQVQSTEGTERRNNTEDAVRCSQRFAGKKSRIIKDLEREDMRALFCRLPCHRKRTGEKKRKICPYSQGIIGLIILVLFRNRNNGTRWTVFYGRQTRDGAVRCSLFGDPLTKLFCNTAEDRRTVGASAENDAAVGQVNPGHIGNITSHP